MASQSSKKKPNKCDSSSTGAGAEASSENESPRSRFRRAERRDAIFAIADALAIEGAAHSVVAVNETLQGSAPTAGGTQASSAAHISRFVLTPHGYRRSRPALSSNGTQPQTLARGLRETAPSKRPTPARAQPYPTGGPRIINDAGVLTRKRTSDSRGVQDSPPSSPPQRRLLPPKPQAAGSIQALRLAYLTDQKACHFP